MGEENSAAFSWGSNDKHDNDVGSVSAANANLFVVSTAEILTRVSDTNDCSSSHYNSSWFSLKLSPRADRILLMHGTQDAVAFLSGSRRVAQSLGGEVCQILELKGEGHGLEGLHRCSVNSGSSNKAGSA